MYDLIKKCLPLGVLGTLLCLSINAFAQAEPVGAEFYGEWNFSSAQAQERPLNTQDPFTLRNVTVNDLQQHNYFYEVPTTITFGEEGAVHVEGFYTSRRGTTYVSLYDDETIVYLMEPYEMTDEEIIEGLDVYEMTSVHFFNPAVSGNTMTLQYRYFYGTGDGNARTYTDGTLTVTYKKLDNN
ncbi:MAG: hypothetical protein FWF09_00370 [Bacteroidales bacterium]|nr:hypothetical protein [Bacteroidales bacterium]